MFLRRALKLCVLYGSGLDKSGVIHFARGTLSDALIINQLIELAPSVHYTSFGVILLLVWYYKQLCVFRKYLETL
jgi:hypothetical protein